MGCRAKRTGAGFSFIEAILAVALVTAALGSLVQLFVLATGANQRAKRTSMVSLLASQKVEELRSFSWSYDEEGVAVMDPRLVVSAADALERDIETHCEYLAADGELVGIPPGRPGDTAYIRRWSVSLLPADSNALVLQVRVISASGDEHAHLRTIKTRRVA